MMDYQNDVRLSVRDELPDEIDSSDIAENIYGQLFHTELVWPVVFFGVYSAFEPDVSLIIIVLLKTTVIYFYHDFYSTCFTTHGKRDLLVLCSVVSML